MVLAQQSSLDVAVYHFCPPTVSPLYDVLVDRFDFFEEVWGNTFSLDHVLCYSVIADLVESSFKYAGLIQGFVRARSPGCHHGSLYSKISKAGALTFPVFFRTLLDLKNSMFGAVPSTQTFAACAKWYPHIPEKSLQVVVCIAAIQTGFRQGHGSKTCVCM